MVFQETEKVELKRVVSESLPKEIVAFLNTYGGTIYIGVEDDGKIIGINNLDDVQRNIADIITTQILPNPQKFIELGTKYIDGNNIVEIKVNKGDKLYYIKKYGRSSSGCFIRIGTTCRSLSEDEIESRYVESLMMPEKSIKDIAVLRDDFTFVKFKQYLIGKGIHINDDTFYKNFNLITFDGKFNILAELLADENMNSIKVAVFKGKDKSCFIKRNEYGYTCLIESLERVLTYCDTMNETFIDLSVRPRNEHRLFSPEAFKEAWINACVHNKWSEQLCPAVYWFDDRLEIVSYGGLPKNLTKEEFLRGKTEPVNKELMNIFLQCGIVEHSGHGVPIVVKEYGEDAYSFSQNMITVTIPFFKSGNLKSDTVEKNEPNQEENEPKNEPNDKAIIKNEPKNEPNQEENEPKNDPNGENNKIHKKNNDPTHKVLEIIEKDPSCTIEQMTLITNLSRETIKRSLKYLREKGIIKRVGTNRVGYWEIIK